MDKNHSDRRVVVDAIHYRLEDPSYPYGYVPALKIALFEAVTDKYIDDIFIYCSMDYELILKKNKDLDGKIEGISSAIFRYTSRETIIEKIAENIQDYLRRPDVVKVYGAHKLLWGMRGRGISSLLDDPDIINFGNDCLDLVRCVKMF